jgi:hypothetical protein
LGHDVLVSAPYAKSRTSWRAIVAEHLGLAQPTVPGLIESASVQLGTTRADRSVGRVRHMRRTQRYRGLSALAALVVGTRQLGQEWWSSPHGSPVTPRRHTDRAVTPDEHLAAAAGSDERSWLPIVVELGHWIADDVAVAMWGPLIAEVDLNDPRSTDRIKDLPADLPVGSVVTAWFDTGGVVDAVIEQRDGALGSQLVAESSRYSPPAEVDWGWAVARPRRARSPFPAMAQTPTTPSLTRRRPALLRMGRQLDVADQGLGLPWRTRGDTCAALARLDWPWLRDTRVLEWVRAVEALIDGT